MTFRGDHPDELISASLTGDLTDAERAELDAHLAHCERCRATLAAFKSERRILSGLPAASPPRDLSARVRGGIESGRSVEPWWRRAGGLAALGASAATLVVVLAVVVLNERPAGVGQASGSPQATLSSGPSASVADLATTSASPVEIPLDPPARFEYTLTNGTPSLTFTTPGGGVSLALPVDAAGAPQAAVLSPDSNHVAFRIGGELSGLAQTYVGGVMGSDPVRIGESLDPAGGFGGGLAWSSTGRYLAYTLTSPTDGSTDVWVWDRDLGEVKRITDTGDAFAGSWMGFDSGVDLLWVSRAGETPNSYAIAFHDGEPLPGPLDPAASAFFSASGVFLPLVAPDYRHIIFWRGQMARSGGRWHFERAGLIYLGTTGPTQDQLGFETAELLFPGLALVQGEGFADAEIRWGLDSDAFVLWDAHWTGIPQPSGFPDDQRVYLGHLSNGDLLTSRQALDVRDLAGALRIADVDIAPDGVRLGITVLIEAGAESGAFGPTAELREITRGIGEKADTVSVLGGGSHVWSGPAMYGPCCFAGP